VPECAGTMLAELMAWGPVANNLMHPRFLSGIRHVIRRMDICIVSAS